MENKLLRLLNFSKTSFYKTVFILCVLFSFSSTKLTAQQTWNFVASSSDEFSGTELDTTKWDKGLWYDVSGQLAFKDENVTVANGNLVLTAKKENYNGKAYTIGAVESKFDIPGQNSYVEVRAKVLPSAANVLSAIWMQSSPLSSALDPNPEIDIMESFHFDQYSQALHLWHTANGHTPLGGHNWNTGVDISLDYHVYKLERIDGKLKFYFDDILTWETSPADQSFYDFGRHMVLSLEGHLGQPNDAELPKSFLVDYVRTYVEATSAPNPVKNNSFETGSLSDWSNWGSNAQVFNNQANAQDGTHSVRLSDGAGGIEQTVTGLQPNTTYTLSGWAFKHPLATNTGLYVGVKNYGGAELSTEVTETTYTKKSVTFTTGATNTTARIYIYRNGGTSNIYADNFSVAENSIIAAPDTFLGLDATAGETSATSVLDNDVINGQQATTQNVTLTTVTAPSPASGSITLNTEGKIVVAANTTPGTYDYTYQICDTANPQLCSSVTSTIEVEVPEPDYFVENGSFETGDLTNWSNWGDNAEVFNNPANSKDGSHSVRLSDGAGGVEQTVTGLKANTTYTLSGWAFKHPLATNTGLYVGVKNYGGVELSTEVTETTYTKKSVTFTTGANNTTARIYFYRNGGASNVYGDYFRIVEGSTPAARAQLGKPVAEEPIEEDFIKDLSIYPNPVVNGSLLNVGYNSKLSNEKINISLVNLLGQEVLSKSYNLEKGFNKVGLQIRSMKAGIYLLRFNTDNQKAVKKIVITH